MENEEAVDQSGNDGRELNQKLDKLMGMFNQMYGAIEDMHANTRNNGYKNESD